MTHAFKIILLKDLIIDKIIILKTTIKLADKPDRIIHNDHSTVTAAVNSSYIMSKTVNHTGSLQVRCNFTPLSLTQEYFKIQMNEDNSFRVMLYLF